MSTMDTIIGIIIVGAFFFIICSRVYEHEKEHIDPIIEKIKGWFNKEGDSSLENDGVVQDYDLDFLGKAR